MPAVIPTDNLKTAVASLAKFDITNPLLQTAILSVIAKETGFVPKNEYSYSTTSNDRLRQIFSVFKNYTDAQLNALKKDDVAFYEVIYGGKYGNKNYGDGWKYRGRGLNGITFKSAYQDLSDTLGLDLVNNPEKLNEFNVAADALGKYFSDSFHAGEVSGYLKKKVGIDSIDQAQDLDTAVRAAVQANAGWKTDFNNSIIQEGYHKALDAAPGFYTFVNSTPVKQEVETVLKPIRARRFKKKAIVYGSIAVGSAAILYLGYRYYKHRQAA
jgi:putative chitinase